MYFERTRCRAMKQSRIYANACSIAFEIIQTSYQPILLGSTSVLRVCIVLLVLLRLGFAYCHVHFVEQIYIAFVDIVFVYVFSNISELLLSFNVLKL